MQIDRSAVTAAAERIWATALCVALLGAAWALDPYAEAAFDAPKRLIVFCCAALAGVVWILSPRSTHWRQWPPIARWIAGLMTLALGGALLSTWLAPHAGPAWSAMRSIALYSVFLVLGASALVERWRRLLLLTAGVAVASNGLISIAQAAGWALPIPISHLGGRFPTGALLGNEGYVALACTLLGAAACAHALSTRSGISLLWLALAVAVIGINRQLTSALALGGSVLLLLVLHWRFWRHSRWCWIALLAGAAATAGIARQVEAPSVERMQQLSTYRLAGWAAGIEMVRARPWIGFGPGSYARESQRMRLRAELRWRERLLPPPTATTFAYAHQEYLQLAAECGLLVLLCVLTALVLLLAGLLRLAAIASHGEARVLVGVLVAGAIASLAWFPLQIPLTACLLLLAAGRAFRLLIVGASRG